MNNSPFIFPFSDCECIEIKMHSIAESLHCCTQIPMIYKTPLQEILMSVGSVKNNMYMFAKLLRKALANTLPLDSSIHENIGYFYNQDLHEISAEIRGNLKYEIFGALEFWVGQSYQLWAYRSASWLYNDKNGDIVFQITPLYFSENKNFDAQEYQEFMKNYAPILTKIIPKPTAEVWLHKAESILHEIEDSINSGHHH